MPIRILAAAVIAFAVNASASAQGTSQTMFPGWAPSLSMVSIQEKAEAAFEAGKYRRAMWLYSKELAPIGDKFAQYMVAHMHEKGLGVPRDPVQAGAWYSLAAERGHEPIVEAAEAFHSSLPPGQLAAAHDMAASLKEQWGDKALVRRAIKRDYDLLSRMAGTRIRPSSRRSCGGGSPGRVFVGTVSMSFDQYCDAIYKRIDTRFAYLEGYVTYGELELVPDEFDEAAESSQSDPDE